MKSIEIAGIKLFEFEEGGITAEESVQCQKEIEIPQINVENAKRKKRLEMVDAIAKELEFSEGDGKRKSLALLNDFEKATELTKVLLNRSTYTSQVVAYMGAIPSEMQNALAQYVDSEKLESDRYVSKLESLIKKKETVDEVKAAIESIKTEEHERVEELKKLTETFSELLDQFQKDLRENVEPLEIALKELAGEVKQLAELEKDSRPDKELLAGVELTLLQMPDVEDSNQEEELQERYITIFVKSRSDKAWDLKQTQGLKKKNPAAYAELRDWAIELAASDKEVDSAPLAEAKKALKA